MDVGAYSPVFVIGTPKFQDRVSNVTILKIFKIRVSIGFSAGKGFMPFHK